MGGKYYCSPVDNLRGKFHCLENFLTHFKRLPAPNRQILRKIKPYSFLVNILSMCSQFIDTPKLRILSNLPSPSPHYYASLQLSKERSWWLGASSKIDTSCKGCNSNRSWYSYQVSEIFRCSSLQYSNVIKMKLK